MKRAGRAGRARRVERVRRLWRLGIFRGNESPGKIGKVTGLGGLRSRRPRGLGGPRVMRVRMSGRLRESGHLGEAVESLVTPEETGRAKIDLKV